MNNSAIKKCIFLAAIYVLTCGSSAWSAEPFTLELSYNVKSAMLRISFTRWSENEVRYFLQKLSVYKDEKRKIEQDLMDQNYLKQWIKLIPIVVTADDIVKIDLHYGNDEIYHQEIAGSSLMEQAALPASGVSVPNGTVSAPTGTYQRLESPEPFGYSVEDNRGNGRAGYGYESKDEEFGYSKKDDDDYWSKLNGHNTRQTQDENYGYRDAGHYSIRTEPYGHRQLGRESTDEKYGRREYKE